MHTFVPYPSAYILFGCLFLRLIHTVCSNSTLATRPSRLIRDPRNSHFQRPQSSASTSTPPSQAPPSRPPASPVPRTSTPPPVPRTSTPPPVPRTSTPPPQRPPPSPVSSESDSDFYTMSFSTTSPTTSGMATIKYHDAGKAAPILNDGIITPSVLQLWKKKSEIFFDVRKIEDADRVKNVLSSFSSQTIVNWINENEDALKVLPWVDFMTQLKKTALTPGCDTVVFRTMVNIKQPKNTSFCSWMNGIRGANFSLSDTRFHKDADSLHSHIESHVSDDLADFFASLTKNERDRVEAITDLEEWLREMTEIDENMSKSRKQHLELVEDAVKRQRTSFTSYRSSGSCEPSSSSINSVSSIAPSNQKIGSSIPKFSSFLCAKVETPPGYRFPPKLMESERELLQKYLGCRICRQLFADHKLPCNLLPPDASSYEPITMDLVNRLLAARSAARSTTVAAMETDLASHASVDDSSFPLSVSAVLPSTSVPFALGTGSVSSDEVCPLSLRHLLWGAKALGPLKTFISVSCLIDTSAHINCVRSDVVDRLNLKPLILAKPLPVTLAFEGSSEAKPVLLSTFVEFSLSTISSSWSSRTCKAVIVPNLCADFIFGLPFLSFNKIVIDCKKRTVIHTPSNINLLDDNSTNRKSLRKFTPLSVRRRIMVHLRKILVAELKVVCGQRRHLYEETPVSPPQSFLAIIRTRVESLAFLAKLKKHKEKARTLFVDVFAPVPHLNRLPISDLVMRISLMDDKRFIQKRNYTVPKHYEKAMDKILDLRLSQGFIRPSNSQFVSPSFIVPKSDPSALPRCTWQDLVKDRSH